MPSPTAPHRYSKSPQPLEAGVNLTCWKYVQAIKEAHADSRLIAEEAGELVGARVTHSDFGFHLAEEGVRTTKTA